MTFWQIFVRVLPRSPIASLKSLWWQITGRRVRACNQIRIAATRLPFAYEAWISEVERSEECSKKAAEIAESWSFRPSFVVWLEPGPATSESDIRRTKQSVERQIYTKWILADRTRADAPLDIPDQTSITSADFMMPITAGDELSPLALFRLAEALQITPDADIVYGDHDHLDAGGKRTNPWFKPRWNDEMFLAKDYLSGAAAIRSTKVQTLLSSPLPEQASFDEILIALTRSGGKPPVHAPHIVAHLRAVRSVSARLRAELVNRLLSDSGASAKPGPFDTIKVSWPLPSEAPLVSIIIPTKDKLDLLRPCVESVLKRTTYEPFEILIIDNGSVEKRTARFFDQIATTPRVRVIPCPGPYNYSRINNRAVEVAAGQFICLLNNDTEVVGADWLTELMRQAVRSHAGAVGAKLLYPDGSIQHAGVVVGIGHAAGHAHRNLDDLDPGYFSQAHVSQFISAVTGACLVVEKEKYLSVGGLDEESLAVAFNDVDLCLKLERAGWRNVYVPHAVLIHHESKSRGKDSSPTQIDRYKRELALFQERWGTKNYQDALFNPNLDPSSETFLIRL